MSWQPIVVGVDASPEAAGAAGFACRMARVAGTSCHLVHGAPDLWASVGVDEGVGELRGVSLDAVRAHITAGLADAVPRDPQQVVVGWHLFGGCVSEIGQQGEAQLRVGVGQGVQFQPLQQSPGSVGLGEEAGDDHESRAVLGDAVLEVELGQHARRQQPADERVEQTDGQFAQRQ